jgi:hypothetical protein
LASSCFQAKRLKKITKKKKNAEKGRNLRSSSHSTFLPLAPASSLLFLPFHFKCFLLGIFSFLSRRKERKKNHKEEKKCKKGKEFTFIFLHLHLG